MIIFIGIAVLVFVGMLFGFHIQVSTSFINVITSIGTLLGGFGAAYAAFMARQSVGEWRNEFHYKNTYNQLSEFETLLQDIFIDFGENIIQHTKLLNATKGELATASVEVLPKYAKRYAQLHNRIMNSLPETESKKLRHFHWNTLNRELMQCLENSHAKCQEIFENTKEKKKMVNEQANDLIDNVRGFMRIYDEYREITRERLKTVREIRDSL
ncbi:hypothetical protein RC861_004223 [Vibrio parahaemolyticus]|nr:hypothetical protein [Vibrio parahaemolyticus]